MKNKLTETKLRPGIGPTRHLISGVLCLAVISLICPRASAQNLFMTDGATIYQFTPDAVRTTFASGLSRAFGLTFDSEGNLFVVNHDNSSSGQILKFTRDGLRSTFALGLNNPGNLAFDSAGNLFTVDTGGIYKFTPMECEALLPPGYLFPSSISGPFLTPRATCLWQMMRAAPSINSLRPGYRPPLPPV